MLLFPKQVAEVLSKCLGRESYSIATSTSFLDSTRFYSVPSLSYKAHQIALEKLNFVFASDG